MGYLLSEQGEYWLQKKLKYIVKQRVMEQFPVIDKSARRSLQGERHRAQDFEHSTRISTCGYWSMVCRISIGV